MTQRGRTGRGSNRNNNAAPHGEEAQLWESSQAQIAELVAAVNADNANLAALIDADKRTARTAAESASGQPPLADIDRLEALCRNGVRTTEQNANAIRNIIEQLTVLSGVQKAKELAAEGAGLGAVGAGIGVGIGGAGAGTAFAGGSTRRGKAAAAERDRERERERERERGRDRDRDRERDRETKDGGSAAAAASREGGSSVYDIETATAAGESPPAPSPVGSARKAGSERLSSLPLAKRESAEPPAAAAAAPAAPASSSGTSAVPPTTPQPPMSASALAASRSKIVFAKGDEVAFKPKSTNGESTDWILGEVAAVLGEGKSRRYKVLDVEPDDQLGQKEHRSSASNMIPITSEAGVRSLKDWSPGKEVLALYPQTTTFYKAEVISTAADGRVNLRFEGENDSTTMQQVERRFVIEYRG